MYTGRDVEVIVKGAVRAAYEAAASKCDELMRERSFREGARKCASAIRALKESSPTAADGGNK